MCAWLWPAILCTPLETPPWCRSHLGPEDLSFRALFGRLKFTVRRHKFTEDSLSAGREPAAHCGGRGQERERQGPANP